MKVNRTRLRNSAASLPGSIVIDIESARTHRRYANDVTNERAAIRESMEFGQPSVGTILFRGDAVASFLFLPLPSGNCLHARYPASLVAIMDFFHASRNDCDGIFKNSRDAILKL